MKTLYGRKDYTQGHLRSLIKLKVNQGYTYREVLETLSIGSTRTVSKRVNSSSIESKSSAPNNPFTKYSGNELMYLYVVRKYLGLYLDDLIDYLEDEYDISFKRSSAHYYLKKWGLTVKPKKEIKKFKEYNPGYLHIDITYGPQINGKKAYIYVAIDRKTRLIYLEVHTEKSGKKTSEFLKNVINFFPFKIHTILTDNGAEFTVGYMKSYNIKTLFEKICKEFNIDHRKTKSRCPQTNGMVESHNNIIKKNTLNINHYNSTIDLKKDVLEFMLYYNLYRRHGGIRKEISVKTPFNALEYYYKKQPNLFKETPNKFRNKLLKYAKKRNLEVHSYRDMSIYVKYIHPKNKVG